MTEYELASWYLNLCETNNDAFLPLFTDEHRYLVLKGGGGSGKSIFAGRKIVERAMVEGGHRFLVCRKVGKEIENSCYNQLVEQFGTFYPGEYRAYKSPYKIKAGTSEILFTGLDDVDKLRSIYNITGIWIEEASEITRDDFNQLNIRLRGATKYYKQIILSFNPVSMQHWLKTRFFDNRDADTRTSETTYKNNRFLDEEQKAVLEGFRESDEYYYNVYCLGNWGVTGKSVFPAQAVQDRIADNVQPVAVGMFTYEDDGRRLSGATFEEDKDGFIQIYKEPEKGVPYVLGGDTAGEGSDKFVAQVIDNRTGEQVAILRHTFDEDLYARQVYCLGMYYNTALVGIETNYSTYPIRELERLGYPKLYVRETVDDFTHKPKNAYGFRTDGKTRPVIISGLVKFMRANPKAVCDKVTLEEMLTFVRNEEYRPEAEAGAHDDTVMALAIAHHIRPQQRYTVEAEPEIKKEWTKDMHEDYRRANKEERAYLVKKWGVPKN